MATRMGFEPTRGHPNGGKQQIDLQKYHRNKIQTLENNNSHMHDNIQKLVYKLNNIDLDSAHMHKNITELSHKMCQLQEHNTQLNNSLSLLSGNVKEFQKHTSTIMLNIQNQQEYIDNLADSVENLKEKTSSVFSSTPKPPPGFLKSQIVPDSPFFASNSIPGFVIPVISQSHQLDISADMILQIQYSKKCLGEILSVPSVQLETSPVPQNVCVKKESPVHHDTGGSTGLFPVPPSESPVNSLTAVTPSPVMQSQHGEQNVSTLPTLQSAETKPMAASCHPVHFQSQRSLSSLSQLRGQPTTFMFHFS